MRLSFARPFVNSPTLIVGIAFLPKHHLPASEKQRYKKIAEGLLDEEG
jgi:hypothetical protein